MSHLKSAYKFQTRIPQNIRAIAKKVIIKKPMPTDSAYLKAVESTLSEWNSEYDDQDYSDI